jgi:NADH-quinone oxidoreductase subunit M
VEPLQPGVRRLPVRRAPRLIPAFGIEYAVGVDGISLLLIVLTGFGPAGAARTTWESVRNQPGRSALPAARARDRRLRPLDLFLFYIF